jgi:hypothetical protein
MKNQNEQKITGFWLGFSAGIGSALVVGYFFGTKQGRSLLKKGIVFSENIEENISSMLSYFDEETVKKKNKLSKNHFFVESIDLVLGKIKNITNHS